MKGGRGLGRDQNGPVHRGHLQKSGVLAASSPWYPQKRGQPAETEAIAESSAVQGWQRATAAESYLASHLDGIFVESEGAGGVRKGSGAVSAQRGIQRSEEGSRSTVKFAERRGSCHLLPVVEIVGLGFSQFHGRGRFSWVPLFLRPR